MGGRLLKPFAVVNIDAQRRRLAKTMCGPEGHRVRRRRYTHFNLYSFLSSQYVRSFFSECLLDIMVVETPNGSAVLTSPKPKAGPRGDQEDRRPPNPAQRRRRNLPLSLPHQKFPTLEAQSTSDINYNYTDPVHTASANIQTQSSRFSKSYSLLPATDLATAITMPSAEFQAAAQAAKQLKAKPTDNELLQVPLPFFDHLSSIQLQSRFGPRCTSLSI